MVTRDDQGRMLPSPLLVSVAQRAAFIEVLGRTGVVTLAAAELGLPTSTLYRARKLHREFAAEWDGAVAARKRNGSGWDTETRAAFVEHLATAASPAAAATKVGRTLTSAYRLRATSQGFAADWLAAQEQALDAIEAAVAERALGGVRRTVKRGTETIETVEFSDRLAMFLLKALRPEKFDRVRGAKPAPAAAKFDRDELIARFKGLSRRFAREAAETQGDA